jgi:hypothetical protein
LDPDSDEEKAPNYYNASLALQKRLGSELLGRAEAGAQQTRANLGAMGGGAGAGGNTGGGADDSDADRVSATNNYACGDSEEGKEDDGLDEYGQSAAGAGTGKSNCSTLNPKDPTPKGHFKKAVVAMKAGRKGKDAKGSTISTKLLRSGFPTVRAYSVIVRQLFSVALHRAHADLLLSYVYFQEGDGSRGVRVNRGAKEE